MKRPNVFKYRDYKEFLRDWLDFSTLQTSGAKTRLSQTMGCQPAYLSQVLNASSHLTPEQALAATRLVSKNQLEADYFFHLVMHDRAGTKELKTYFSARLKDVLAAKGDIKKRLPETASLTPEEEKIYYSRWYYLAVHIALYIPALQRPDALAKKLGLEMNLLLQILEFLASAQLIALRPDGSFAPKESTYHLKKDSPLILQHHTNWRLKALASLDSEEAADVHYSSVISLAKKDAENLQALLLEAIDRARSLVRESEPEEELYSYCIDFFRVSRS